MTIRTSAEHPEAVYHAAPGVTFHRLKEFLSRGPAWYCARYVTCTIPPPPPKDWATIGRAYHVYGLEGEDAFRAQVVAMPATYMGKESAKKDAPMIEKPWNMNANACQEWVAQQTGKIVLTQSDYAAAVRIGRNMRANTHASRLLSCGWQELTIEQPEPRFPVPVKGRIDWLASTSTSTADAWAIADPKGTSELDRFEREAFKFAYHRQMAWYRKLVRDEIGRQLPVFMVAVELDGMHRPRVYRVDDPLLDIAEDQNNRDLDRLAEHYAGKPWTLDHEDHIRTLTAPEWMTTPKGTNGADIGPAPWEMTDA